MRNRTLFLATALTALALGCDGSVGQEDDELLCSTQFTVSGTAVLETKPADVSGCWPVGTWTFTLAQTANSCNPMPTPLGQYQIRIERDLAAEEPDHTFLYHYQTDPADATATVSVSSSAGGVCEGILLLYSADGKQVWNLHPALHPDSTIDGLGDFETHSTNQIPKV